MQEKEKEKSSVSWLIIVYNNSEKVPKLDSNIKEGWPGHRNICLFVLLYDRIGILLLDHSLHWC